MHISIEGHHYQISDATRTYVSSGVEKLERFYSPIIDCKVTLTQERDIYRVDVIAHVHGQTLKSADEDAKLYRAVDGALDKMARQLQKLHDKRRSHRPVEPQISTPPGE